jgi:hypothetical protein
LVVVTGGLRSRGDTPEARTADWCLVEGALQGLSRRGAPVDEHVETVLPDPDKDWNVLHRFHVGRLVPMPNRNAQSRRFFMVSSADVVISIEGEGGTRSVLDLAAAIDIPVLPLPFGTGASRELWNDLRTEIVRRFVLPPDLTASWEHLDLARLSEYAIAELAVAVKRVLLNGFTRNCFVIMPFGTESDPIYDEAIKPGLAAHGLNPVRTDRLGLPGNVIETIRRALASCYLAIADTTGDRPNVMYELGMAHAAGRPVVLLRRAAPGGGVERAPFDIQSESMLTYTDDLVALRGQLEAVIAVLLGKSRSMDEHGV